MLPKHNKIQPNLVKFLLWAIANAATSEILGREGGVPMLRIYAKGHDIQFNYQILLEVQKRGL